MALNLRLNEEEDRMLNELAKATGFSKNQTVTRLIREAWDREEARRIAHAELDRIYAQRTQLMERLKDA
ncbi:hypothetical protein [Corynebacterium sp. Marseille-P4321]|uniref:hypothetical protein n=1 Tax=Corynebacterium sp. Marseille-P4321 TaxID=2736603 RepID=UPI000893970D|nr:hypothetical protein [Corynebacterium sp. Marseille-P4321]OEY04752.1 hypothetical protein A0K93_06480 [Corynebacterium sp. BCW_4722]